MNLIEKYLVVQNLTEILGRGHGQVLSKVKGKDIKKLEKLLKSKKINYTKDTKGTIVVGDDDMDDVEEIMMVKLGIY